MSQAMNGFLSGLGQGITDVGKTAFNANIEHARELRLRQYQKEDHAEARGEAEADYQRNKTDRLAEKGDDRTYTEGQTALGWEHDAKVTEQSQGFQSKLVDKQQGNAVANAKTQHAWNLEAATASADAAAAQFEREGKRVKDVKVLEESITDPLTMQTTKKPTGEVLYTFENGESTTLNLKSGTTVPNQQDPRLAQQMEALLKAQQEGTPKQPPPTAATGSLQSHGQQFGPNPSGLGLLSRP